mmetsp:Transcript_100015/g.311625  ORF Transcript_100015/g.311625 Transcript_100015/m.311625 type:complete len:205 (-) Transcript_100015:22-636(-)
MSSNVQDDSLQEVEELIAQMEALERKIADKKEQRAFVAGVIKEKELQCRQAKEQHEERVQALARQARRSRVRRAPRDAGDLSASTPEAVSPPEERPTAAGALAGLNTEQVAKALGTEGTDRLVRPLLAGVASPASASLPRTEERLAAAKRALEERLDLLQCLNTTLQRHAADLPNASGSGLTAIRAQVEALQPEVASLIDIDAN